jgi:hypothetical protein
MPRVNSRSIAAIIFWVVFAAAIAFAPHHPWLRYGFALGLVAVLLASVVWFVISAIHSPQRALTDHGYPRWFLRFANDHQSKPARLDTEKS